MPEQGEFYGSEVERIVEMRRRDADVRRRQEREVEVHVERIAAVRGEIETKITELTELCVGLQRHIRRVGSADVQSNYRAYTTMQLRMAGAMNQAMTRAKSMDRVILSSKAEAEERRRVEEWEKSQVTQRNIQSDVARLWLPQEDDMAFLYGEEALDA